MLSKLQMCISTFEYAIYLFSLLQYVKYQEEINMCDFDKSSCKFVITIRGVQKNSFSA